MAEFADLDGLQVLHRDLVAQAELRLPNIERLWAQLEGRVNEFRRLLQKSPRNDQSRQSLNSGKIKVQDDEYAVNEDFKQGTLQLADALNLDELDAAQIFFAGQDDSEVLGRSVLECSIIRFHQYRKYLLDCLRLILQMSTEGADDEMRQSFQIVVSEILQVDASRDNGKQYVNKCLDSMKDIKAWLQDLADKLNSASILGQGAVPEFAESIEFQRASLIQQHESLGTIVHYLAKGKYSATENFDRVLMVLKQADKYDNLLVHYIPAISSLISVFGSQDCGAYLRDVRKLNTKIVEKNDQNSWTLQYVHAAVNVLWLSEYSGWYVDNPVGSPLVGVNLDEENKERTKQFTESLKDGAFDFLLTLSADVKSAEWQDPARHGLRQWLQRKAPPLIPDAVPFSRYFQLILMEQIESFIDAFISNMPDVLRKLRLDEDEQRQLSSDHIHDLDLERFLVIISYAFEGRPEASLAFWSDPDSNLAGFLQWASRRASTPLVSAFCEMLQAISEDDECATAAHNFLLDEGSMASGRLRRSQSLTWSQIFKELQFFASKLRDQPALHQTSSYRAGKQTEDQIETEPESAMMLESYLRLITRLCSESKAARTFLLKHPTFHLPDLIYQLASSDIPSRLRACAFTTLRSLLSDKSKETSDAIWTSLDAWISSGHSPSTSMPRPSAPIFIASAGMEGIFQKIGAGFEEPHAFVQLLTALTSPCEDDDVLHDSLPFPENLGGSNRMAGMDPYIDFAVGQVFARKTIEVSDPIHLRLLSLACLEFIATCLATFNEDLVIFANRSSIEVDGAIKTSNLAAYVRLHPFSRTMEWMFNDRVMNSLFASIHQDVAEVGNAAPDSPLILSLLHAINVVTLIMNLQPTYLDIVRPAINMQEDDNRRSPVSNTAFASFEDGVLNHLSVIADLGLYCGAGHAPLTVSSLKLLEKFSTSPKLIAPSASNLLGRRERNKIIAALELNNESERIARSLVGEFDGDINMEQGQESSSYQIKMHILDFLNACLVTVSNNPTIGHLLLGFHCLTDNVDIALNSPFANGVALFHSIMKLVIQCPVQDENGIISGWLSALRSNALQVLRTLWKSSLTSEITMTELRRHGFLTHLVVSEVIVTPNTMWDTTSTLNSCFNDFIHQRSILFQYAAAELRKVSQDQYPSMKQQICNNLLGSATLEDGSQIQNATIFDMADFMELDLNTPEMVSDISYLGDLDFSVCLKNLIDEPIAYDIKRVESLLILRRRELKSQGRLQALDEETAFENQAQTLILYVLEQNQATQFQATHLGTMEAWTQVLIMLIQSGGIEGTNKLMVIIEAMLLVQSKLEKCSQQNLPEAQKLASLAKFLMFNIDLKSKPFEQNDVGHMANDRLFQLFSVSLRAIQSPIADASLKETLYNICYQYLTGMSDILNDMPTLRKHSTQTIKSSGERLISIICDDAYAGDQTCRISALLLLSELVTLARREESTYIIDTLTRLNFISLVVDSLKNILDEIRQVRREDIDLYLSYCHAKLGFLLETAQTRYGARIILGAGFFQVIKESEIFSQDPDIGVDVADSSSVRKHYDLLSALMRIINAAAVSCGTQNEQMMGQSRKFISENRLWMLTVFKRAAKIGARGDEELDESVEDLADAYMLLISVSGFLDLEDEAPKARKSGFRAFT